jgi:hypothetical protein
LVKIDCVTLINLIYWKA